MYVYIKSERNLWTVGHYSPNGEWIPQSDHNEETNAEKKVIQLNGGSIPLLDKEKHAISVGLTLAGDYLKLDSKNDDEKFEVTKLIAEIVVKLALHGEFGKACRETAGIGQVFIKARNEIKQLSR
jgi:hypothetical protein